MALERHAILLSTGTLVLAGLDLSACGGGGGGSVPIGRARTAALAADPDYDGRVADTGFIAFTPREAVPFTGDLGETFRPTYDSRQIYAFPLSFLPPGAQVLRAELRIYQADVVGDPYGKNGDVVVDHVGYIERPGADSWDEQTLSPAVGVLSRDSVRETKNLDVTAQVMADLLDGTGRCQFRLRYWRAREPDLDDENDLAYFSDAEISCPGVHGEVPVLRVEYEE